MSRNTEPLYVLYVSEIHPFGNRPIYFDSVVEKFVATLRFFLLLIGKIECNSHQQNASLKYMPSKGARDLRAGQY